MEASKSLPFPLDYELLKRLQREESPVLIATDKVLDVGPRVFEDIGEFKVILAKEVYETDLLKATLWIHPHAGYVGALGGSLSYVYKDFSTTFDLYMDDERQGPDPYLPRIRMTIDENQNLRSLGLVDGGKPIPIGSSFYSIRFIDSHRLSFKRVEEPCQTITVLNSETGQEFSGVLRDLSEDMTWGLPAYGVSFNTIASWGATGRNFLMEMHIAGKSFDCVRHYEPSRYAFESDFPVFLRIGDSRRYIRLTCDVYRDEDYLRVPKGFSFSECNLGPYASDQGPAVGWVPTPLCETMAVPADPLGFMRREACTIE